MTTREKLQMMARIQMAKEEIPQLEFIKDEPNDELFYDQFSGQFFRSNKATILAAELNINRELMLNGICPVSRFYDIIGLDFQGDYIWEYGNWVDFDHIFVDFEDGCDFYHLIVMIPEPHEERR
jgi:hypothetical protein